MILNLLKASLVALAVMAAAIALRVNLSIEASWLVLYVIYVGAVITIFIAVVQVIIQPTDKTGGA